MCKMLKWGKLVEHLRRSRNRGLVLVVYKTTHFLGSVEDHLSLEISPMVRRAATATLAIDVDREGTSPLYVQIYGQLRDLILSGRLTAGARLPSSRALMTELGVSRTAVLQAFEQLGSEGYIEFRWWLSPWTSAASDDAVSPLISTGRQRTSAPYFCASKPISRSSVETTTRLIAGVRRACSML